MDKSAYIISQSACAIVEAIAILVDSSQDSNKLGNEIRDLILKYNIHHNAVISYLNGY